ncbi:MAG: hypothetical protein IJX55_10700 [Clostridia bacterium]|nr:hypothetical protein [Clostridia bacterium]
MKEIDILGANRFETFSKTRIVCRGIVIQNGKLLVSREEVSDYWMLPGEGTNFISHCPEGTTSLYT